MTADCQPPADLVLERAVLSAVMCSSIAFDTAATLLDADDFYDQRHALVWRAARACAAAGEPVDVITVHERLQSAGQDKRVGLPYLVALVDHPAAVLTLDANAAKIAQLGLVRRSVQVMESLVVDSARAFADPEAWLDRMRTEAARLAALQSAGKSTVLTSAESARLYGEYLRKPKRSLPFGITRIDHATGGGLLPGELTLIGARTGVGKTTVSLQYAEKAQRSGRRVLFFCGEMSAVALQQRYVSKHTGIPLWAVRERMLRADECADEDAQIGQWELLGIKLKPGRISMTLVARECALNPECDFIVLDGIQRLLPPHGERYGVREQEVAAVAREASEIAVRRDVTVLATAQLNKGAINSTPDLGDMRESDALNHEASTVLMLSRDQQGPDPLAVQCVLGKNRSGDQGVVKLRMNPKTYDLEEVAGA